MAQFQKLPFGKYTSFFYLLMIVAVMEFIGLAGVLGHLSQAAAAEEPADAAVPVQSESKALLPVEKPKPEGELSGQEILAQNQIIAHGLGSVDGSNILNCREGFENMYRQGVRVFEADIRLTRDGKLVLRHDWRSGWQEGISEASVPSLKEFLAEPVLGKYTPMSFRDLLFLMKEYQDICIITDTKYVDAEIVRMQFDAMLSDAADLGLTYLLDRFAVQFYNPTMLQTVDSIHHFSSYIYTLYQEKFDRTEDGFRELAAFCAEEENVLGITISEDLWDPAYGEIASGFGLKVFTHTVNDPEKARSLLEDGISSIYTDSLTPALLVPDENAPAPASAGTTTEGDSSLWN